MKILKADPERIHLDGKTGIFVRALAEGRPSSVDIACLDRESLSDWLRSRGGKNEWAESVVLKLLGHDGRPRGPVSPGTDACTSESFTGGFYIDAEKREASRLLATCAERDAEMGRLDAEIKRLRDENERYAAVHKQLQAELDRRDVSADRTLPAAAARARGMGES